MPCTHTHTHRGTEDRQVKILKLASNHDVTIKVFSHCSVVTTLKTASLQEDSPGKLPFSDGRCLGGDSVLQTRHK